MTSNDLVEMRDGVPMVSSLQVAERFGKRHGDVLRSIQTIDMSEQFRGRNFAFSSYDGNNGRSNPLIWMTRDGFSFLVMGFTWRAPRCQFRREAPTHLRASLRVSSSEGVPGIWRGVVENDGDGAVSTEEIPRTMVEGT